MWEGSVLVRYGYPVTGTVHRKPIKYWCNVEWLSCLIRIWMFRS